MSMAVARSLYRGSAEPVVQALLPACKIGGKSWLTYDEAEKVAKARLNPAACQKHALLLGQLHLLQSNLSFKRTTINEAFYMVRKCWGPLGASTRPSPQTGLRR